MINTLWYWYHEESILEESTSVKMPFAPGVRIAPIRRKYVLPVVAESREVYMSLQFGVSLPQGWNMELAGIKDPIEAYEVMTRVAQTADEVGFASAWLVDHFHTTPRPSQEVTFECWTTTAALACDTRRIRIGQTVTCNGYRNPARSPKWPARSMCSRTGDSTSALGLARTRISRLWLRLS
jgi:hypothetical protein